MALKEKEQSRQNDELPKPITTKVIQDEPGPGPTHQCLTSVTIPQEISQWRYSNVL